MSVVVDKAVITGTDMDPRDPAEPSRHRLPEIEEAGTRVVAVERLLHPTHHPSPDHPKWRRRLTEILEYARSATEDQEPIDDEAVARFIQLMESLEEIGAPLEPMAIFPNPEGILEIQVMKRSVARVLEIHPDGYKLREIDEHGRRRYHIATWRVAAELLAS